MSRYTTTTRNGNKLTFRDGEKENGQGGVYFLLFIVFLVLKLTHTIDWSWWFVTMPLWAGFALVLFIVTVGLIFAHPILRWEAKQNARTKAIYDAREAVEKSMANHPAGKARVDLGK